MISYKERLPKITTFIFDVDGVLTAGEVFLYNGEVIRMLNSKDGYAIQYAGKKGYSILVITGGNSQDVRARLAISPALPPGQNASAWRKSCCAPTIKWRSTSN